MEEFISPTNVPSVPERDRASEAGGTVLLLVRAVPGLSHKRLMVLLGVSRQTVNAIENGRYDPSLPLALRMAKLFAVPVDQLFIDHWDGSDGQ